MRFILLLLTSIFLIQFSTHESAEQDDYASSSIESIHNLSADENAQQAQHDFLLAEDDRPETPMVRCNLHSMLMHMRVMNSRIQWRSNANVLIAKKLVRTMATMLAMQTNHEAQTFNSLRRTNWQYAADCYVFAFRQILI